MLLCGKIVNTHGLDGTVKLLPYTDAPSFFDTVKTVYLSDKTKLSLLKYRQQKGALLMRFREVDTVEKAEKLRNCEIFVSRADAMPLPEGRYYIADIIGLSVFCENGRALGKVTDVLQTGSNDVYVVKGDKEYLIPVIDEVILEINPADGRILIKPLKGLLDDED